MEPYVLTMYVTIEQETAIRDLFAYRGWPLNKYGYTSVGHQFDTFVDGALLYTSARPPVYQPPPVAEPKLSSGTAFTDGPAFSAGPTHASSQVSDISLPQPDLAYSGPGQSTVTSPDMPPLPATAARAAADLHSNTRVIDHPQGEARVQWQVAAGRIDCLPVHHLPSSHRSDNLPANIAQVSQHRTDRPDSLQLYPHTTINLPENIPHQSPPRTDNLAGNLPHVPLVSTNSGDTHPHGTVVKYVNNPDEVYTNITTHTSTPATIRTHAANMANASNAQVNSPSSRASAQIDAPRTQRSSDTAAAVTSAPDRTGHNPAEPGTTEERSTVTTTRAVTSHHKPAIHAATQTTLTLGDIASVVGDVDECVNTVVPAVKLSSSQVSTHTCGDTTGDMQKHTRPGTDVPSSDMSKSKRKSNTSTKHSPKKKKDSYNAQIKTCTCNTNLQDCDSSERTDGVKQVKNIRKTKIKAKTDTRQRARTRKNKCTTTTTRSRMRRKRTKVEGDDALLTGENLIEECPGSVKVEHTDKGNAGILETVELELVDIESNQLKSNTSENYQITLAKNTEKIPKGSYHCNDCNVTFKSYLPFVKHKRNGGQCVFVCHVCGKSFTFKDFRNYELHIKYHNNERGFPCSECGKSFFTADHLAKHVRSQHRRERPYVCDKCGQSFAYSSGLISHTLWRHSAKTEEHACDICGKKYVSKYYVARHKKCVHTDILAYMCNVCGRQFKTKPLLSAHVDTHSEIKRYSCDLCGRRFRRREGLKTHQQRHNNERNFVCGSCGRAFYEQRDLVKHARLHSGDRPYTCDVCTFRATRPETLSRHKKIHNTANNSVARRSRTSLPDVSAFRATCPEQR